MKKGIILTSFGTSYEETRKKTIEALEREVAEKYSEIPVIRAFTSRIIARILKGRGYPVDNPGEALEKMKDQGIKEVYIQPSLIIEGHEYDKTIRDIEAFKEENQDFKISFGSPLLTTDEDYVKVVKALDLEEMPADRALVYMGHGSDHIADKAYDKLEDTFRDLGMKNVFVGTVEGSKTIEDIIPILKEKSIKEVELRPFMIVAGDHAINDMASDEEDSWKTILEEAGFKAEAKLIGLGEIKGIRDIFIEHLEEIME